MQHFKAIKDVAVIYDCMTPCLVFMFSSLQALFVHQHLLIYHLVRHLNHQYSLYSLSTACQLCKKKLCEHPPRVWGQTGGHFL